MASNVSLPSSDTVSPHSLVRAAFSPLRDIPLTRPAPPKLTNLFEELSAIEASAWFTNYGPVNTRFERAVESDVFARIGACVTTCNATLGLMLALKHVTRDAKAGCKYVLMPSFTFAAAAQAVLWAGFTPLLCDIDEKTWASSPDAERRLMARYGAEVAALMPYATFGEAIDLSHYEWLAAEAGIPVVVDAAASLGCIDEDGLPFGLGSPHPIVFSMHATKAFATAEGGLIYCADVDVIEALRAAGNFGFGAPRSATMPGLNGKMSEIGALLALARLRDFNAVADYRDQLGRAYRAHLPGWTFQEVSARRIAHQFMPVLLPPEWSGRRSLVMKRLAAAGVGCGAYFSPHVAEQPYFREMCRAGCLDVTESVAGRVLSLPMHDDMTTDDVAYVCARLQDAVAE